MMLEDGEEVTPLPGTNAQYADGAGRPVIEGTLDLRLNEGQAPSQRGVGTVVAVVPFDPIAGRTAG